MIIYPHFIAYRLVTTTQIEKDYNRRVDRWVGIGKDISGHYPAMYMLCRVNKVIREEYLSAAYVGTWSR